MISLTTTYDLIAIGSGPAGQRAAVQAAKLGKRVRARRARPARSAASRPTPARVPSKTLRAAIVELTGRRHGVYGNAYRVQHEITIRRPALAHPPGDRARAAR